MGWFRFCDKDKSGDISFEEMRNAFVGNQRQEFALITSQVLRAGLGAGTASPASSPTKPGSARSGSAPARGTPPPRMDRTDSHDDFPRADSSILTPFGNSPIKGQPA